MDSLLRASLLRFSPLIPGVNYPMTYVGARNTFFCWHVEDNHLPATNYVVSGAPKVWYAVPYSQMAAMEGVWKALFPSLFARHPDLCYWKTCAPVPRPERSLPALSLAAAAALTRRCAGRTFLFAAAASSRRRCSTRSA